jgi:hypothetical protein
MALLGRRIRDEVNPNERVASEEPAMSFQGPRRSNLAMMAAASAMMSLSPPKPIKHAEPEPDKTSRQHKRWLQRQARKQERKHRKR